MIEPKKNPSMIRIFHVNKSFGSYHALIDITLDIFKNDFMFVTGSSGAGKSTLLKLLYLGERVSAGEILVDGMNLSRINRSTIPYLRRKFGSIFQDYKLIPNRTVFDNVSLVLEAAGKHRKIIEKKVASVLKIVRMENKHHAFPPSLSGGEQQRVAVARAIAGEPRIILADEPTGSLDPESAGIIMDLLQRFHRSGATVIVATHDRKLIYQTGGRIVHLDQGRLVSPV